MAAVGEMLVFVADPALRTLMDFSYKRNFKAQNRHSRPGSQYDRPQRERPTRIPVPVGTVVYDEETGAVMANMDEPNKERRVLTGGARRQGQRPSLQSPPAERLGLPYREQRAGRFVVLELKSIADIGLVASPMWERARFFLC